MKRVTDIMDQLLSKDSIVFGHSIWKRDIIEVSIKVSFKKTSLHLGTVFGK